MKKKLLIFPFFFLPVLIVFGQKFSDRSVPAQYLYTGQTNSSPTTTDESKSQNSVLRENRNIIGFNMDLYGPTGKFASTLDGAMPSGFGLNYLRESNSRWSFGGELSVAMYYKSEYDLQTTSSGSVPVYEEDCFWTVRALARYNLIETEYFSTYSEFRLGMNNFFSDVSATVEVNEDVGKTVSHGHSLVGGFGLGADIGLGAFGADGAVGQTYITLRGGYNMGSPTYYRSAKVPSGQTNDFEKYRYYSEISYFDFNIGMARKF